MTDYAVQIERLRLAVEDGHLPADLGSWLLAEIISNAPAAVRRALRDRLLVAAAQLLDPNGSTWSRAQLLRDELAALERRSGAPTRARRLMTEALAIDPSTPHSLRQLVTILQPRRSRLQFGSAESDEVTPHVDPQLSPVSEERCAGPLRKGTR